jgi:hypothetical protein
VLLVLEALTTLLERWLIMFVSESRREANRRNAQLSTGPKTAEGKERSRLNALKHGLCSSVVVAEDASVVMTRTEEFFITLKPQNDFHCWLVSEVALESVRIERAERMERRIRDKIAMKAELTWDDDRRLEAILLGSTLGNRPDLVVEQLRKNVQGCEWLMARWAMLAYVADVDKTWTPEQTALAFDLLGTPDVFRVGKKPGDSLDFEGKLVESGTDLAALARREIAELKERRERIKPLDEVARALAMADLGEDNDPELIRLRRQEATLYSRLRWCLRQLQVQSPFQEPQRGLKRKWIPDRTFVNPVEELKPPEPLKPLEIQPDLPILTKFDHPPFDLLPEESPEPGEVADIAKILKSRQVRKSKKAQARRESRRRKVENLRA